MPANLTIASRIVRNSAILVAQVDDEVVAMNVERGTCYGLNRTGTRIWSLIESPISISDICARLMEEFAVMREECEEDVLAVLGELRAEGLIELNSSPGPSAPDNR